jgi:hypothetical protein
MSSASSSFLNPKSRTDLRTARRHDILHYNGDKVLQRASGKAENLRSTEN